MNKMKRFYHLPFFKQATEAETLSEISAVMLMSPVQHLQMAGYTLSWELPMGQGVQITVERLLQPNILNSLLIQGFL